MKKIKELENEILNLQAIQNNANLNLLLRGKDGIGISPIKKNISQKSNILDTNEEEDNMSLYKSHINNSKSKQQYIP